MFGRKALLVGLFSLGFSLLAQGATGVVNGRAKAGKAGKPAVVKVRQKDGSVMVRLNLTTTMAKRGGDGLAATAPPAGGGTRDGAQAKPYQLMDQWLEAVTEPRFMTALAAVAMEPGNETRVLNHNVDPALVRNWAEFVDPELYLRWMAAGLDPRFNQAIHNRSHDPRTPPRGFSLPIQFALPADVQAGTPLKPTIWSNAFGSGPTGQAAAEEWLTLPTADPKANPWLRAGQNYRY